ncbi:transcription repressor OFP13-like [Vigna radiata var. radiata]|uniref:Transcription repressor n=1 Tax=Vigna radiata var. radiata TaxID=3916 RepID=A0A1S3V4U6_VIGRR|nr:transcription repressor OFP13-like [Vigna radiata var. radiata]
MKFFSRLKNNNTTNNHHRSSWPWPSCHQPRTLSFRATTASATTTTTTTTTPTHDIFKGSNSIAQTPDSFFTDSPNSDSFSTASDISHTVDSTETVIRGLRSDRLFFEPDPTSSLWEAKLATLPPFKNSVVFSMDSTHPYVDFRRSMEDMVATHSVRDWEDLEDLLCWFLKVNAENTHHYILRAFVDFLFSLALASSSSNAICSTTTTLSSLSSSSSSCTTRCTFCIEEELQHQHIS